MLEQKFQEGAVGTMNYTTNPDIIARVPHVDVCACQKPLPFEFTMAF